MTLLDLLNKEKEIDNKINKANAKIKHKNYILDNYGNELIEDATKQMVKEIEELEREIDIYSKDLIVKKRKISNFLESEYGLVKKKRGGD